MKYVKPVVLAQNSIQSIYSTDCSKTNANRVCGSCQYPK